jgi:hypothetical protein
MKVLLATLAAAGIALSGTAALAQSASVSTDRSFVGVDTDRNGGVSWAEFELIFTDINEEQFNAADLNKDGVLDEDEFGSLTVETGSILPAPALPNQPASSGSSLTYTAPES